MWIFNRPLGRFRFLLISILSAVIVLSHPASATPAKTIVKDVVYRADGSPAQGTIVISWPAFTASDSSAVAAGTMSVVIGTGGQISIPLVPNADASPSGRYYKAVLKLTDGTTSSEYWSVPARTETSLAVIRVTANLNSTAQIPSASLAQKLDRQGDTPTVMAGIRFASKFSSIQSAVDDASGNGAVLIPPDYAATDSYSNANGVAVLDLRNGALTTTDIVARGPKADVRAFGASGSAQSTSVDCSAGSQTVSLSNAIDLKNGQGVQLYHCGSGITVGTPPAPSVRVVGQTGSKTYAYKIAALTAKGGETAASPAATVSNANPTGWNNYNEVKWNAIAGAQGYAVYRSASGGTFYLLGVTGVPGWAAPWVKGRPYHLNDYVQPRTFNGHYYKATSAVGTHSLLEDGGASGIVSAGAHTITPASMNGIVAGGALTIQGNTPNAESVIVTSVTASTFTATFSKTHPHGFTFFEVSGVAEPSWCLTSGCSVEDNGIIWTEQEFVLHDVGQYAWTDMAPPTVSITAPASALADSLVTGIVSGAGTKAITIADAAQTTINGVKLEHDDTAALRAAVANIRGGRQTVAAPASGLPATQFGTALYLPYGTYNISAPLTDWVSFIHSDGQAVLRQTNPLQDAIHFDTTYEFTIDGIGIWGGYKQIYYGNSNSGGVVHLRNVDLESAFDYALYVVGAQNGINDNHMSSAVDFSNGKINGAKHIAYNTTDALRFKNTYFYQTDRNQDSNSAWIANPSGYVELEDVFIQPNASQAGQRLIDNRQSVSLVRVRLGGEAGGLPVIYNLADYGFEPGYGSGFGAYQSGTIPYYNQLIRVSDSELCRGANRPDAGVVVLIDAAPSFMSVKNNGCSLSSDPVLNNYGGLNLDTYFQDTTNGKQITSDQVKYQFEPNAEADNMVTSAKFPVGLMPYFDESTRRLVTAVPVAGNWKQGQAVWNSNSVNAGNALGWITLSTGKAAPKWSAGAAFSVDQFVVPTTYNGHVYRAAAAGSSGASEPAWPTATNSVITDGGVTWVEAGPAARFVAYGLAGCENLGTLCYSSSSGSRFVAFDAAPGWDTQVLRGTEAAYSKEIFYLQQRSSQKQLEFIVSATDWNMLFKTALNAGRSVQLQSSTIKLTSGDSPYNDLLVANGDSVNAPQKLQIGSGTKISKHISATATLQFPAIAAQSCSDLRMTVSGAGDGDTISLGVPNALASIAGLQVTGWVNATDQVTVRACNTAAVTSGALPTATVRADIWKH